jgi:hypothetical protein
MWEQQVRLNDLCKLIWIRIDMLHSSFWLSVTACTRNSSPKTTKLKSFKANLMLIITRNETLPRALESKFDRSEFGHFSY